MPDNTNVNIFHYGNSSLHGKQQQQQQRHYDCVPGEGDEAGNVEEYGEDDGRTEVVQHQIHLASRTRVIVTKSSMFQYKK